METEEILVGIQKAAETIATPNWADKLSVAMSLLAVVVAGIVAWKQNKIVLAQAKIAEQQNKIALFEKRFTVYENMRKVVRVAEEIAEIKKPDDIWPVFQNVFFEEWHSENAENIKYERMALILNIHTNLEQAEFLFSEDIANAILFLRVDLLLLTRGIYGEFDGKLFEERKMKFCQDAEAVQKQRILEKIQNDLQLQSIRP